MVRSTDGDGDGDGDGDTDQDQERGKEREERVEPRNRESPIERDRENKGEEVSGEGASDDEEGGEATEGVGGGHTRFDTENENVSRSEARSGGGDNEAGSLRGNGDTSRRAGTADVDGNGERTVQY